MLVRFRPEACLAFEAFILAAFAMWQVQPFKPKSASRASSSSKPVIGRAAKPAIGSAAKPVIGSATITSDAKPVPKGSVSVKKSAVKPVPKVCLWTKTAKQVPRVKDEGKDEMKEECKDEVTDEMQCCSACNSMEEEDEDIEEASLLDQALHAAVTAHEDDKEYLQQTVDEILGVWHDVFSAQEHVVSERTSWRSCWGRLQSVLGGHLQRPLARYDHLLGRRVATEACIHRWPIESQASEAARQVRAAKPGSGASTMHG